MKKILLIVLLPFILNAQTIWYVDRDATGSANGTSWANAWTSISSSNQASGGVNYASLSPGDTIYVSGGTDSTLYATRTDGYAERIYPSGSGITYASGNPVVIAPAWQSGHNGGVYFGARDNDTQWLLAIHNISNIKLTGFNFIDNRTARYGTMLYLGGAGADGLGIQDSLITIENCRIVGNGLAGMMYLNGYKITLRDCYIDFPYNASAADQDPIGVAGGRGGITIEGCKIVYRNASMSTKAHRDILQFSNFGYGAGDQEIDNIIRNNILVQPYDAVSWNAILYSSNPNCKTNFYVYNNIFVSNNTASPIGNVFVYQPDENPANEWTLSIYVLNNTMVYNSPSSGMSQPFSISGRYLDTLIIKNNVVTYANPIITFMNIQPFSYMDGGTLVPNVYHREVDYNAYSQLGGIASSYSFYAGERFGDWTLTQWLADGWDTHSLFQNSIAVTFTNKWGEDITDYYTETGRDIGVDITVSNPEFAGKFPDIAYDILGNPRSGTWDIGALEYQDGAVDTAPTFSFTPVTGATRNGYYTTSSVFTNADSTFHVWTATNDSFKVGALSNYDLIMVTADSGDTVFVSNIASGSFNTANVNYVVAGGNWQGFSVTTVDSLPDVFTFTDITSATRSTVYTSDLVTFTGFDSAYAYAGGAEYQINSGSWVTDYTKVFNNDNARVRLTSSGSYSTGTGVTLTVGDVSDIYTVTTEAGSVAPSSGAKVFKTTNGIFRTSNGKVIRTQ